MSKTPVLLALFASLTLPAVESGARTYRKGETVTVTGRVTEGGGAPLADVAVVLEVSRTSFKLGNVFRRNRSTRVKGHTLRVPTTTDAGGGYSVDWSWDPYYDTFELAVALPVRRGGHDDFEVFHRRDVTAQVRQGSPVAAPLVVEATPYFSWLRSFLGGRASADEQRIFGEMGRPDRIDGEQSRRGSESAWWYFEAGKVYRFLDGALEQIAHFEPIPPLE